MKTPDSTTFSEPDDLDLCDPFLRFSTEAALQNDEPSQYLLDVHGTLLVGDETGERAIGSMSLRIVQASRASADRVSLFDVCDCVDQSVYDHADAVYDLLRSDLRDDVLDGIVGIDVMMIESLTIAPQYRRRGLGLVCIRRAIDAFGGGLAGVVLKPFPLQFAESHESFECVLYAGFETNVRSATRRLRRYYGKLGFRPVSRGSEFYVLDLSNALPAVDELIASPPPTHYARAVQEAAL